MCIASKWQAIAKKGNTYRQYKYLALCCQTIGGRDTANDQKAIHMVSAWASKNRLVLGQTKVDKKSNEITAIPF